MMDMALMQMTQNRVQPAKQANDFAVQGKKSSTENSFDKVFSTTVGQQQQVNNQQPAKPATATNNDAANTVEAEIEEVVQTEGLQQLFDLLGIEYDESMLFVELNGELVAIDELMNLEAITEMLGMTPEQLNQMIAQLTDGEIEVTDIWSLLEQAPQLLAHITATLNGENSKVPLTEAGQLVQVLKLATLLGNKTDTVYSQEVKLNDTKNALQSFLSQLQNTQETVKQPVAQAPATTPFTKVVEQVVQGQQKQETSETQNVAPTSSNQNVTPTRTVTVTLPMDRSQQSEALIKEIQNLLNRSQLVNNGGTIKLMLKLFPENLGQIRIEIMQQNGVMQARILASTSAGKELLDSSLNQLKSAFVAHNIQMDRIDVTQALQNTDEHLRDQGFLNQFFRNQQDEVEEEQKDDEESVSFEELLEEQIQTEEV